MRTAKTKKAMISSRLVDAGGPASGMEPSDATRIPPALFSSQRLLNDVSSLLDARSSLSFLKYSFLGPELNRLRNHGDTRVEDVVTPGCEVVMALPIFTEVLFIRATLPAHVNDLDGDSALLGAALNHQFDGGGEFQLLKNFGQIGKPLNFSAANADDDVAKSSRA